MGTATGVSSSSAATAACSGSRSAGRGEDGVRWGNSQTAPLTGRNTASNGPQRMRIRMRCGPFDAVFLPVNGAVCEFPHRTPSSPLPADLDPEQAAVAAELLETPVAVPIHYDA